MSHQHDTKVFTVDELADLCRAFTGERKHDQRIGRELGMKEMHIDILRTLVGKSPRVMKFISQEQLEDCARLYREGYTAPQICEATGICQPATVFRCLHRMGVTPDKKPEWTPMQEKRLIYLREVKKQTWPVIAPQIGKKYKTCQKHYLILKQREAKNNVQGNDN